MPLELNHMTNAGVRGAGLTLPRGLDREGLPRRRPGNCRPGAAEPERSRRLKEASEEPDLPIRVDALDWHAISQSFRESD